MSLRFHKEIFSKAPNTVTFQFKIRNLTIIIYNMSLVVRKPAFCICVKNDADQLHVNREADQRLCFCYINSTIPLLSKSEIFKPLAIFCGCAARFESDQVGNPEDRFSHNEAHIIL